MSKSLDKVLALIAQKKTPKVILIGGTSDYMADQAFRTVRDAIVDVHKGIAVEAYEAGSELPAIIDSYRTMSLFAPSRLLIVPEVNAFVSAKELTSLLDKALADWKSAKTDRKRASSSAKLLHVLGLAGADLEMTDTQIARALGATADGPLAEMLAFCRASGKKAGRGEDDAALLMDAINNGGASGTYLLLRTGEIPKESATVDLINREGAVVVADVSRESFLSVLEQAIGELSAESGVQFTAPALARLRQRLGIERVLADKFSKDVPDLRSTISEAERLITLAGSGGRVTPDMVDREIASVEGGARYEFASLFTEGKHLDAVVKLRELVAQARREDPKTPLDIQYGRFLFPLADEIRQMIGIRSFAKLKQIDLRAPMNYNRFKDSVADSLGEYLKQAGIVRQKPHPFPLLKKWEAARNVSEASLFRALEQLADMEIQRKSGGLPIDVGIEAFVLGRVRA